jgi:hemerythrin superfamily protein
MFGRGSSDTDAVEVLKRDHDEAERLLDAYEDAKDDPDPARKAAVALEVCRALAIHAQVEEELFYPALRAADDAAAELLNEAAVEHATVKNLVAAIEANTPDDPLYDATVRVLGEYVKHHVKEEEGEIFPLARKSSLDLDALGAAILERKQALQDQPPERRRRNGGASAAGPTPKAAHAGAKGARKHAERH